MLIPTFTPGGGGGHAEGPQPAPPWPPLPLLALVLLLAVPLPVAALLVPAPPAPDELVPDEELAAALDAPSPPFPPQPTRPMTARPMIHNRMSSPPREVYGGGGDLFHANRQRPLRRARVDVSCAIQPLSIAPNRFSTVAT